MAVKNHLKLLRQGVDAWNAWREKEHLRGWLKEANLSRSDLEGANFIGAYLTGADLSRANLGNANLRGADLSKADLSGAHLFKANLLRAALMGGDLSGAHLIGADLTFADLSGANLTEANLLGAKLGGAKLGGANLTRANLLGASLVEAELAGACLTGADLSRADLSRANLTRANLSRTDLYAAGLTKANLNGANLMGADIRYAMLVKTNIENADLTGCRIYGTSAWDLTLSKGTKQQDLIITDKGESQVTVDHIEMAQFVYLLLHNEKIRDVIDTIGKKGVLLLGRFTGGRIAVLERLRDELWKRDFLPIVFNFDKPETKDFTETVRLLAGLSRFVIVDITNPRSAPLELQATVPDHMIPFVPIIQEGEPPFAMFKDLWVKYEWVLKPISYASQEELVQGLDKGIVEPALAKFKELMKKKADEMPITPMRDIVGR